MNAERNVLLIRPASAAEQTASKLAKQGYGSVILPISEIRPIDSETPEGNYDSLVFTSAIAPKLLGDHGNLPELHTLPVYCVGDKTALAATACGFKHIACVEPDAASLAQQIHNHQNSNYLYPCATERSFDFESHFSGTARNFTLWEIYSNALIFPDQKAVTEAIKASQVVFLYSKRAAIHFFQLVADFGLEETVQTNLVLIAISEQVRACVPRKYQPNTYIGLDKSESGMIQQLKLL